LLAGFLLELIYGNPDRVPCRLRFGEVNCIDELIWLSIEVVYNSYLGALDRDEEIVRFLASSKIASDDSFDPIQLIDSLFILGGCCTNAIGNVISDNSGEIIEARSFGDGRRATYTAIQDVHFPVHLVWIVD